MVEAGIWIAVCDHAGIEQELLAVVLEDDRVAVEVAVAGDGAQVVQGEERIAATPAGSQKGEGLVGHDPGGREFRFGLFDGVAENQQHGRTG